MLGQALVTLSTVGKTGDYSDLLNIPVEFAPATHFQTWATIQNTPTTLLGYGITDALNVTDIGVSVQAQASILSDLSALLAENGKALGWSGGTLTNLSLFSGSYNDLDNKPDLSAFDNIDEYANLAAFPATGLANKFYVAQDTGKVYRWNGTAYQLSSGELPNWGQVQGTLSDQTDLQNALNAKQDTLVVGSVNTDKLDVSTDVKNVLDSTDKTDIQTYLEIGSGISTALKTADFLAESNTRYGVDTTLGVVTATLPSAPTEGDSISFFDAVGFDVTSTTGFGNNKLIIECDVAHTIHGADILEIAEENACIELVFQSGRWNISGGLLTTPIVNLDSINTDITNLQTQTNDLGFDLDTLTTNFNNHDHSALYSALGHTHDYAATNHTHSYAAVSHTHSYAATNHSHSISYWSNDRLWVRTSTASGAAPVLNTDGRIRYFHWSGNVRFALQVDATWMYINPDPSDIRWKTNVTPLDSELFWERTLNAACTLPIVSFDWKEDSIFSGHESIGIIAQDLEAINPNLVITDPNGFKHIVLNKCVVMLLACVKSLKAKNNTLETRLQDLDTRITTLENN